MQAAAKGDLQTLKHKQLVILYNNDIEINCSIVKMPYLKTYYYSKVFLFANLIQDGYCFIFFMPSNEVILRGLPNLT